MIKPISQLASAIINATSPTVTLLIGPPGSGKTTLTRLIQKQTTICAVSTDDIIQDFADRDNSTYNDVFKTISFKTVETQMLFELQVLLDDNLPVIVDRTNMSRKARNKILSRIPKHYIRFAAIFMPERSELDRRLEQRGKETGKIISPEVVDEMLSRYEEPTSAEFSEIFK